MYLQFYFQTILIGISKLCPLYALLIIILHNKIVIVLIMHVYMHVNKICSLKNIINFSMDCYAIA